MRKYTKPYAIILCIIVVVVFSCLGLIRFYQTNKIKNTPTYNLKIANNTYTVLFEDNNCSEDVKTTIVNDVNLVREHMKEYEILSVRPKTFNISGKEVQADNAIHFIGPGRKTPEEYEHGNNLRYITQIDGQNHIIISRELTDACDEALTRIKKNKQAIEKLDNFLNTINQLSNLDPTEEMLGNLFYFTKGTESFRKEFLGNLEEVRSEYGKYRYRRPSLFDIKYGYEAPLNKIFTSNQLFARSYMFDQKNNLVGEIGFVYDNAKWKIAIIRTE